MSKMSNMNGIKGIIETHRARLEASGLMRQVVASPLPPHISQIVTPHAKALAVLRECPERIQVQPSPMTKLFEYTLPKLEVLLNELGEERAEQIVIKLCEHGKEMIDQHGLDGARKHLKEMFADLPDFEIKISEEGGAEELIEAYKKFHFQGIDEDILILKHGLQGYLRMKLGPKIESITTKADDKDRICNLEMAPSTNDTDLKYLRRAADLQVLYLEETQVSDLTPLSGLTGLLKLKLRYTPVSDLTPLHGLTGLRVLDLRDTQVVDLTPLRGLVGLQELYLWNTQVRNLLPLRGLAGLSILEITRTPAINKQLAELRKVIPGIIEK